MKKQKVIDDRGPSPSKMNDSPAPEHLGKRKRDDDSTLVLTEDIKARGRNDGASTSKSRIVPALSKRSAARKDVAIRMRETDEDSNVFLRSRMSPKLLLEFITHHMSDQQKSDIESMGFGGLLMLKTNMVPSFLAYWLVSTFNTWSVSLMDERLLITEEDIYLSTGIPMGPTEIELAVTNDQNEDFLEVRADWLKQFSETRKKVKTQEVFDLMITQQGGGDDFKRNFIVFIVSTFLMGVKGSTASLRILKCLKDLSCVPSLNWCGFTLKQLVDGVDVWRSFNCPTYTFGGPIMVLVFIYLDRVRFKYEKISRVFPTLASWSKSAISKRMKDEHKVGFGKGLVQPRLVRPSHTTVRPPVQEPTHTAPEQSAQEPVDTSARPPDQAPSDQEPKKGCYIVKKLVDAANMFAVAYDTFLKVLAEAKIERPECDVVRQMMCLTEALGQGYHSSQQSKDEVNHVQEKENVAKTADVKGKGIEKGSDECKMTAGNEDIGSDKCDPLSEFAKREFSSEDELWAAFLKLEIALGKRPASEAKETVSEVTKETVSVPRNSKMSPKASTSRRSPRLTPPPRFTPPSFPSPPIIMPPSFKLLSSESQETDSPQSPPCERSPQVPPPVSPLCVSPVSSLPPEQEPIIPGSPVEILPEKRSRVPAEVFRSPFLQRNVCVVGDLNQSEKEVLEYIFGESLDDSEILFKNDLHSLTRADLKTILSGETLSQTVTCVWCHILNKDEKTRSRTSPSRFYMPLRMCDPTKDIVDGFAGAALIFSPCTYPKPFVFCFNFLNQKLQVLHHMEKNSIDYANHIESARQYVTKHLRQKMPTIENINGHTVEEIPRSVIGGGDEADTGIYLLRLLQSYKGDKKDKSCDLRNKQQLKIFGARVCYQIVTFTENRCSDKILFDAHALCQKKVSRTLPPFPYTDDELLRMVFNRRRSTQYLYEVLVKTEWIKVNREELRTLSRRTWLIDTVIDAVGVMWTLNKPNILYLPVAVKNVSLDSEYKSCIRCPYLKMHYLPDNASTIDKVFWTIGNKEGDHWFALLSDLKKREHYILDSLPPQKGKLRERNEYVEEIVNNVANVLAKKHGYTHFNQMVLFKTVNFKVPQQENVYDCGMHVIKYIEAVTTDETLLRKKEHYKDMNAYREYITLELLKWEKNLMND